MGWGDQLAVVTGEAWQRVCEDPRRWPALLEVERQTFRQMAAAAIAAARQARGRPARELERAVAEALNGAFLAGAPDWVRRRYAWPGLYPNARAVFVEVARAVIAAGRQLRQARAGELEAAA